MSKPTKAVRARGPGKAMRTLDLVHRWTGGLIGLLLAAMGLTGTLLIYEDPFLRATVPHANEALVHDDARLASVAARYLGDPESGIRSIRFASEDLGVHRLYYKGEEGGGAYVDQAGQIATRWSSEWQRPEIWLFDLHHHFFAGETGTILVGIVGLAGFGFVVTGIILWWKTRSTFSFRPLPKRASRPAIVRHHRDLGIVVAPLLLVSFVTGVMMTLKPVEAVLLVPFSVGHADKDKAKTVAKAKKPEGKAKLAADIDWQAMFAAARARFPDGQIRYIALPTAKQPNLQIRVRRPDDWVLNGRSILQFDTTGKLVMSRDAGAAPLRTRISNNEYPVHTGVPLPYLGKLLLTLSGLALTMLGTLAVATFWFAGKPKPKRAAPRQVLEEKLA